MAWWGRWDHAKARRATSYSLIALGSRGGASLTRNYGYIFIITVNYFTHHVSPCRALLRLTAPMNDLQAWEAQCGDLVHLKDPFITQDEDVASQPTCGSSDSYSEPVPHTLPLFQTQCLWNRLNALPCPEIVDLCNVTGPSATRALAIQYVQTTPMSQLRLHPPVPLSCLERAACAVGALCVQTMCEQYGRSEDQLARRAIAPLTSDAWGFSPYALRLTPSMGCIRCELSRDGSLRTVLLPETVMFVATPVPEMLARLIVVDPDAIQGTQPTPAMMEGTHDGGSSTVSLFRLAISCEDTRWPSARLQFQCVLDMLWPLRRGETEEEEAEIPSLSETWLGHLCEVFTNLYTAVDFAGGDMRSDSFHLRQAMYDASLMYQAVSRHSGRAPCTITTLEVPIGLPSHMQDSRLYFVRLDCGRSLLLCYNCALHFTLPLFLPEVNTDQPLSAADLCHAPFPQAKTKDPVWFRYNLRSLQAYDSNLKGNHVKALLEQTPDHWLVQMVSFFIHRPRGNLPLDRLPLITQEAQDALQFAARYDVSPFNGARKLFSFKRKVMQEASEIVDVPGIFTGRVSVYVTETTDALFIAPIVSVTRGECIEVQGLVVHESTHRPRKRQRAPDTGSHTVSITAKAEDSHTTKALRQMAFSKLVFEICYGSLAPAESW